MGIRLRDDVYFNDPESRIREYCEIEVSEGYDDQHSEDNRISELDIKTANKLYALIGYRDKSEPRRIINQSGQISPLLGQIPHQSIFDYNNEEWVKIKPRIEKLLRKMVSIHGFGVAKATKILHLKRPKLFPVLDSYVVQFLTRKPFSYTQRDVSLALRSLDISREIISSQIIEFTNLQMSLGDLPITHTVVRLFDILCWSAYKWDILGNTNAPRGNASKSLIGYKRKKHPIRKMKQTKPRKKLSSSKSDMAQSIILDFFNELSNKARYGYHGEKPIAVLTALKYL